jgi:hypothetical protein
LVEHSEHLIGWWDIAHIVPIVDEAHNALFVDDQLGRHAAEFEDLDLLTEQFKNCVAGVGQTNEVKIFFLPILLKCRSIFGTHHHDQGISRFEGLRRLTQLRHVLAAKGSSKAAIEDQQQVIAALIAELKGIPIRIGKLKVRRRGVDLNFWHRLIITIIPV